MTSSARVLRARHWLFSVVCLLGLAAPLAACDVEDGALASLDDEALPEQFACGDVTAVSASADGSEALLLGIEDGLVASVHDSGEPVVAHYQLPDPRLTVRWVSGSNVYQGQCGRDDGERWQLDERHDALAGHIEVVVEPLGNGQLSLHAEVEHLQFGHDMRLEGHVIDAPIE